MKLYGLIGYPLAQSFSKKFFDRKFEQEGRTDCRFENFPIESIEAFPALLQQHPDLHGLAVTIPYKQQVLRFVAHQQFLPKGLQACNCMRIRNGVCTGFNTDHIGFQKSLEPLLRPHHQQALVLGNGGATAAVLYALDQLNIGYKVVSRTPSRSDMLSYADLSPEVMAAHLLIINTTPLGMFPDIHSCPPIPYEQIGKRHLLYDLVYNPAVTLFLEKGMAQGASVKNGEDMLVLQAEENWKIWNDQV